MKNIYLYPILFGIALIMGGCKSAPVYNVEQAEIAVPPSARLDDVRQAIVSGARKAGWLAKPVQTGKIIATYSAKRGRLQAVVDIDYDMNSYDIRYRSSHNLKYRELEPKAAAEGQGDNFFSEYNPFENPDMNPFSEEKGEADGQPGATIHKSYNQWVRQLEEKINLELATLPMRIGKKSSATVSGAERRISAGEPTAVVCADSPDRPLSGKVVVTRASANIRSGIGTGCSIVGSLSRGDMATLIGGKGNWYNIATDLGTNAWIFAPLVSRVSEAERQAIEPVVSGKRISIAVIQFKTLNKEAQDIALGELVSETFTSALVNSSIFKITEREQLDKVIREMEMNQTGFIETTDAVEIGKMLHADAIITGSVALLGKQIQLNARVIDIESAYVISADTKTSTYSLANITSMVNDIVARLAARFQKQ